MLMNVLAACALPVLALAVPVERSTSKYTLKPVFGSQQVSNGSTVSVEQASLAITYYLDTCAGKPSSSDRFSTFITADQNDVDYLVAGYGGERAIDLFGTYYLGLPTKTYASFALPSIRRGSPAVEVCTYVYQEPTKLGSAPSPIRQNFDLVAYAKQLGLEGPVATFCIKVSNGAAPSSSSSAVSASSTKTSASASTSSTIIASSSSTVSPSPSMTAPVSSSAVSTSVASSSSTPASSTSSASASSASASATATGPNPAFATSVSFNGQTFVNKGLVGFGALPGTDLDSTGLTIGGIGSAIALKSFSRNSDGTYSGEVYTQPDRGHNTESTVDYVARRHVVSFTLDPYYDATPLNYSDAKSTLQLAYESTLLYTEANGNPTTGLDALSFRDDASGVILPIPSQDINKISTDAEGLVNNADGSFWVSDEYGPYIYKYAPSGHLIETIAPPAAAVPMLNGSDYFCANCATPPATGRSQNQGFEGLAASPDGNTLYALMQSGLVQDVAQGRYARLFAWDVSGTPTLKHAWVVDLPVTNGKGKTLASSDLMYISEGVFLVLSRDGKGNGDTDADSKHKDFLLYTTAGATDIVNTNYTTGTTPVAPKGTLVSGVTPMEPTELVDILDPTQLARFGLHNDVPFDVTLISSKWESAALASVMDEAYPDDYFLISFADNDFMTLNGVDPLGPYNDPYCVTNGYSLDNQALVWRVTIPGRM